ncbi:MAG: DNA adenine methylase [Chloroflexota bacterium]
MLTPPPVNGLSPNPFDFAQGRPFLKWAGGKSRLLGQFAGLYPCQFAGYHEPFVGSAAVYFHLCGLRAPVKRVRLTDSNAELVNCYTVVRDDVDSLIDSLAKHKRQHSPEHYYEVRAQSLDALSEVERAARLIYLNKTCYNGLYRVNRRGQFNVPMGSYKNPGIFDPDELRQASRALQNAEIEVAPFAAAARRARKGDFVYFDPPYHPLSSTANFTSYTESAFGEQEQGELAQAFRELDRKGCKVMLSNSWTPFIRNLYKGYRLVEVKAARAINSKAEKRGKVSELVVLNYDESVW